MDVDRWLGQLGLGVYATAFAANDIDMEILPSLSNDDLITLGVTSLGHRKSLLKAIAALGSGAPSGVPSGASPGAAPADPSYDGQRRPVTVLFVDLCGYTALSERLDAETMHGLLEAYFAVADRSISEHGGFIDKHVGDSVMAIFGAPIAHGDDVERAARAAVSILAALPAIPSPDGVCLQAHAGMALGEVVAAQTGSTAHAAYTVTGDVVNLAARLTGVATAGQIAISDALRRNLPANFVVEPAGAATVKGIAAPVEFWLLKDVAPATAGETPSRFVGRTSELSQLHAMAQVVASTHGCSHVHLRGEAGIGKSRLVRELAAQAEELGMQRATTGFLDFGVEQGRDALQRLAQSLYSASVFAADPVLQAHARDLLGLPAEPDNRAILATLDFAQRTAGRAAALVAMLRARALLAPQLIVIEDLHWASPSQIELLAAVLGRVRDLPCLFVTTSRPEGDPCTGATGLAPATVLELTALRDDEAREMAAGLIDGGADLARDLIGRSGGNPLFLEHLLRFSLLDDSNRVPDSVRNVVLAGVDKLTRRERDLLQAASVLGQRGSMAALASFFEDPIRPHDLPGRYIRPIEAGEFRFTHALIRDSVYDTLLAAARRRMHAKAAAFFAGRDLPLHAQHLAEAGAPGAAAAYLAAAEQAFAQMAFDRATDLAEAGLRLAGQGDLASALGRQLGCALQMRGQMPDAVAALTTAAEAASDPIVRARAEIALAAVLRVVEQAERAFEVLALAEDRLAGSTAWGELSELWSLRGNLHFPRAEIAQCQAAHAQALVFAERSGSLDHTARALGGLGDAAYATGKLLTAQQAFQRCVDLAAAHDRLAIVAANQNMAVIARIFAGPILGLDAAADEAVAIARRAGHLRAEIIACHAVMTLRVMDGRPGELEPYFSRAQQLSMQIGALRFVAENLAFAGEGARLRGETAKACDLLNQALEIARKTGMHYIGPLILGLLALASPAGTTDRHALIAEGERLMRGSSLAHNVLFLRLCAINLCLEEGDAQGMRRHAAALEAAFAAEPLPHTDFLLARAACLARHVEGERGPDLTEALRAAAALGRSTGYLTQVTEIDAALAGG